MKKVYTTTLGEYKNVLTQWYKGTGGGSALASEFQTWSDAKLEKYGIDKENYNHQC